MSPISARMRTVQGFGINRVARDAEQVKGPWPVLRLENLDTDLPLPPEAIPATAAALATPKANSWLPFTGDDDLRAALDAEEWQAITALCVERDLLLIYDAAMELLLFDGRAPLHPVRYPGMAERTLIIGSLSKEFRMIGWRVGWVAGPRELLEAVG